MLTSLRIKNLALVNDLTVELQPGFNVITGETGAGKSIIIGGLKLLLGERADRTLLRSGSDTCSVEAVFDVSKVKAPLASFLEEHGLEPCEQDQLLLKRIFTVSGTNRQFINGSPTSLHVLDSLGEWLVDMHGPYDHQSLLNPARQLMILDAFGGLTTLRERFANLVDRRAVLEAEKTNYVIDEKAYAQQLDLLRFQTSEIKTATLRLDEESELDLQYQRSSNAARLVQLARTALGLIDDEENALLSQAGVLGRTLQELIRIDPGAKHLLALHEPVATALQELQGELSDYAERIELDPARLHELEERLNLIHALKRKYGSSVAEVIAFGETARQKLQQLEQREAELERIQVEMRAIDSDLACVGGKLSKERRKLIPRLSKAVGKQLADLGFKQSQFEIAMNSREAPANGPMQSLHSSGFDTVEFQFGPNPGEPARPLRAIASSGEIARVMLALKTVLTSEDEIPVLIFDEVDANVAGATALIVGQKMRQIARQRQVICITHLAPAAACASAHYRVSKQIKDGRTLSEIKMLASHERVSELARMLGGPVEAARKHAEALLKG